MILPTYSSFLPVQEKICCNEEFTPKELPLTYPEEYLYILLQNIDILQNNGLINGFDVNSNTTYWYFGGLYNNSDSEFRGFSIVNETLSDNTTISHYFNQSRELKGREYKTETYDRNNNLFSVTENNFNFTLRNSTAYIVLLKNSLSYLYDGNNSNLKITNISYRYDNYSNHNSIQNVSKNKSFPSRLS